MALKRGKNIFSRLNTNKLPFKMKIDHLRDYGKDVALNFNFILENIKTPALKWCMSTIKKAKVFTLIFQANENKTSIYKEDIAKKLPEYSYKTIATIIDEGIEKGFYVLLEADKAPSTDRKIKNIRPSEDLVVEFLNWSIDRIKAYDDLIKKYNNKP